MLQHCRGGLLGTLAAQPRVGSSGAAVVFVARTLRRVWLSAFAMAAAFGLGHCHKPAQEPRAAVCAARLGPGPCLCGTVLQASQVASLVVVLLQDLLGPMPPGGSVLLQLLLQQQLASSTFKEFFFMLLW